ncbi:MAG: hypothetical protein AABZ58_04235, partial [Chloroflexota bacterium]
LQIRLAFILPTLPVRAFEAPGALGCERAADIVRRSDPSAGWEYAEAEGRALGIRRLWGYDGQQASAPFLGYSNINVAYTYSEQPMVSESQPSVAARGFAAASLLRPAPFDPAREFEGIAVKAEPNGTFSVTLPDGEVIFAALGFEAPHTIEVGGAEIQGAGLRCVRVKPEVSELCGMNLTRVAGVAELSAPGTLRLRRGSNKTARLTTDVGLSLSADWLGGTARRVEAMTLDGNWSDVTQHCEGNVIPAALVQAWSQRNDRTLIEFRVST